MSKEQDESLSDRLFRIAGYQRISATHCISGVGKPRPELAPARRTVLMTGVPGSDRKTYLRVYMGGSRVIGLLDSGSDLTILQERMFRRLRKNNQQWDKCPLAEISTFSDHRVPILGQVRWEIKFDRSQAGITTDVIIVPDMSEGIPSLILGADLLELGQGEISFSPSSPPVVFRAPTYIEPKVYRVSPAEQWHCSAYVEVEPNDSLEIEFTINSACPIVRQDIVLVSVL